MKFAGLIFYFILCYYSFAGAKLHIFISTTLSVTEIENTLKKDPALKGITPKVFSNFSEFYSNNEAGSADFIIVNSEFSKLHKNYRPTGQFFINKEKDFKYLIFSTQNKWNINDLGKGTVGVVDTLGRNGMKVITSEKLNKVRKINRVTNPNDLFPLLALGSSNYIMITPYNYDRLKEKYKFPMKLITKSKSINYPTLCVRQGAQSKLTPQIFKLNQHSLSILGFTKLLKISEERK